MSSNVLNANSPYSFPPPSNNRLVADIAAAALTVAPSSDGNVKITCSVSSNNSQDYRCRVDSNGALRVTGRRPDGYGGSIHVEVRIELPDTLTLDLKSSGGPVAIGRHRGSVSVDARGGSVKIAHTGALTAHATGGSVSVDGVDGRALVRVSGGSARLANINGHLDAAASGGSVDATFTGSPDALIKTSAGNIQLSVPANSAFSLLAAAVAGTVRVLPPLVPAVVTSAHFAGSINGGGRTAVDLGANAGSVVVKAV